MRLFFFILIVWGVSNLHPAQCCSAAARRRRHGGLNDVVHGCGSPALVTPILLVRHTHFVFLLVVYYYYSSYTYSCKPDVLMYKVNILICNVAIATVWPSGMSVFFRDTPFERFEYLLCCLVLYVRRRCGGVAGGALCSLKLDVSDTESWRDVVGNTIHAPSPPSHATHTRRSEAK